MKPQGRVNSNTRSLAYFNIDTCVQAGHLVYLLPVSCALQGTDRPRRVRRGLAFFPGYDRLIIREDESCATVQGCRMDGTSSVCVNVCAVASGGSVPLGTHFSLRCWQDQSSASVLGSARRRPTQ